MKKILKVFTLMGLVCLFKVNGALAGEIGLDGAIGVKSNYGLLGQGFRYIWSEQVDVHVNVGLDISGALVGIGSRVYSSPTGDKCFFIIPCRPLIYGSLFWGQTSGGEVTLFDDDGTDSKYLVGSGHFASAAFGFYDIYGSWFTTSLEIGYRYFYNGREVTYKSGPKYQEIIDALSDSGIFASFSIGVLF